MRLRLDPRDAERLGCEQVTQFVLGDVTVAEVEELAERFSFDPYDWPHPFLGEIAFEDAGNPDAKPRTPRWQQRAAVWLTLRQAGVEASWELAGTVRAQQLGFLSDEEDVGKDPEPSPGSEGSTTQPSENSSD